MASNWGVGVRITGWTLLAAAGMSVGVPSDANASWVQASGVQVGEIEPPSEAVARYHQALLRRPEPGYLFDRFCGAWISEGSSDGLETFLKQQAGNGEAADNLLLAFFYAREGRYVDAIKTFQATLADHPGSAAAWFEKARVEAATLDFETALGDLDRAAQLAGDDQELTEKIAKHRGQLLARTGDAEAATEVWAALVESRPDDEALREDLVQLQIEGGLHDEALRSLESLIERTTDPQDRITRRMWAADVQLRANRSEQAVEVYSEAINDVGAGTWLERELLARIAMVYRRSDDITGLREKLATLTETHPNRVEIAKQRALVLAELGEVESAIEAWGEIIDRTPGVAEHRAALARLLAEAGMFDEAIKQLEALVKQSPDDGTLRLELAELRSSAGDAVGAVLDVRAYLELSGGGMGASLRAARTLERLGQPEPALDIVREMAAEDPGDPIRRETLAEFIHRLGEESEAIAIWKSLASSAEDAEGAIRASRALVTRGEREAGFEALRARKKAFGGDAEYAAALTETAVLVEDHEAATEAALAWIELTDDVATGERAVQTAARVASRSGQAEAVAAQLEAKGDERSLAETCLLAELKEQLGEPFAADEVLAEAGQAERVLRQRARLFRDRHEYARSAEMLESLLELGDGPETGYLRDLIDMYARSGQHEAALRTAERWKTLTPGSVSPWLREAELLEAVGNLDAAVETVEAARKRFPDDSGVANRLAQLYIAAGQERDAELVFWSLFEAADSTQARMRWVVELAELARWTGRSDRLIELLTERQRTNRQSADPYLMLSEAHRVVGETEAQRQALLEASRIEPNDVDLLLKIASIEQTTGDIDRAVATLRRAATRDTSGRIETAIAELMIRDGRVSEGIASINTAEGAKLDPDQILRLGDALASMQEWEPVVEFVGPHLGEAGDYRVGYLHAVALEESGKIGEAQRAFLRLLEVDTERSGAGGISRNSMARSYGAWLTGVMPSEAIELMTAVESESIAYSHLNRMAWGYGGQRAQQVVHLPGTVDELEALASAHLVTLGREFDEGARELLAGEMAQRGVTNAAIRMTWPADSLWEVFATPQYFEAYADDPAMLALYLYFTAFGQGIADPDLIKKASEMFDGRWPTLALLARVAIMRTATPDEAPDAWAKLQSTVQRVERPDAIAVVSLAASLGAGAMTGMEPLPLEPEQRSWLLDELVGWFGTVDRTSVMHEQVFMLVAAAVAHSDKPDLLAQIIDAEVDAHLQAPVGAGARAGQFFGYFGGGQGVQMAPLSMPPAELQGLPQTVLSLVGDESGMMVSMMGLQAGSMGEALGSSSHALLRAIGAVADDDGERFAELVTPMMEAEPPSLDGFLLAAAWAGRRGESERAVTLLSRATYLPMTRTTRERIDGAIVAYAMETDVSGSVGEAAHRSALRLLYTSQDPQVRRELVTALDALGLEEEAERELDRLAAQPAGGNRFNIRGGGATQGSVDRVVEALEAGRKEAGVRLAARTLESYADGLLAGNIYAREDPEVLRLRSVLRRRDVLDQTVEAADPGDRASGMRLARYGAVLELLEREDKAMEVYERTLEARFDLTAAAALVRIRMSEGDYEQAADVLEMVPATQAMMFAQSLSNGRGWSNDQDGFDRVITDARMMASYLSREGQALEEFLTIAQQSLQMFGGSYHVNGASVAGMYHVEPEVEDDAKPYRERMIDAHDELVAAMLDEPAYAEAAFPPRAAMVELRGESTEPLVDIARRILTNPEAGWRNRNPVGYYSGSWGYMGEEAPEQVEPPSAIEFLAQHSAGESGDALAEEIATALRSARRRDDADRFETLRRLYVVPEDEFGTLAETLLVDAGGRGGMMAGSDPLNALVGVLRRREIDPMTVLEPVLAYAKRGTATAMGMAFDSDSLTQFGRLVAKKRDADAAKSYCEGLANALLGPPDERKEVIERDFGGSQGWGMTSVKHHAFIQQLQLFASDQDTVWVARSYADLYADQDDAAYLVHQILDGVSTVWRGIANNDAYEEGNRAERVIRFLTASPLINDVGSFSAVKSGWGGDQVLFDSVTSTLRSRNFSEDRKATLEWLDGLEPRTFGSAILAAQIRGASTAEKLELMAELGIKPGQVGEDVEDILHVLGKPREVPDGLSAGALAIAERLVGAKASALDGEIEAFLRDRPDPQQGPWEFTERAVTVIVKAAEAGRRPEVDQLVDHALQQLRRNTPQQWGSETPETQLVTQLLQSDEVGIETYATVVRIASGAGLNVANEYALGNTLFEVSYRVVGKNPRQRSQNDDAEGRLRATVVGLRERLDGIDTGLLTIAFAQFLSQVNYPDAGEWIIEWAEEESSKDQHTIWDDLAASVHTRRLMDKKQETVETDARALNSYLAAVARREGVPESRAQLIGTLLSRVEDSGADFTPAARAGMEIAAGVLRDHPERVSATWLRPLLEWFADAESIEQWPPVEDVLDGIIRSATIGRNTGGGSDLLEAPPAFNHTDPDASPRRGCGLLALELAMRAESDAHARRLINTPNTGLGRSPVAWAYLVEHGMADEAARVIERRIDDAVPSYPRGAGYGPELHARLPELFESLSDKDVRLFAEAALVVLPDVKSDSAGADSLPGRTERVEGFVTKLRGAEFESPSVRDRTLLMLASCDAGLDAIADDLADAAGEPPIFGRHGGMRTSAGQETEIQLYLAATRADLRRGQVELLRKAVSEVSERSGSYNWEAQQFLRSIGAIADHEIMQRIDDVEPELFDTFIAMLEELFERPEVRELLEQGYNSEGLVQTYATLKFARHGPEALSEFLEGHLGTDDVNWWRYYADLEAIIKTMGTVLSGETTSADERLDRFRSLVTHKQFIERMNVHSYVFLWALDNGLITADQIEAEGETIAEAIGDNAWMGLGFAANKAGLGELSDRVWRRAVETQDDVAGELHFIRHMIESDRHKLALEMLSAISPLNPGQRDDHARMVRNAREGLAAAEAGGTDDAGSGPETPGVEEDDEAASEVRDADE